MKYLLEYVLPCLFSYLVGSVSFSIILTNLFFKADIREYGSKNAGGTNVARTIGFGPGVAVVVLDAFKCWGCMFLVSVITGGNLTACAAAGFFCILGHAFPVFFRFKGGKGVAAAAGFMMFISPVGLVSLLLSYIIIVLLTRYISLASVIGILFVPLVSSVVTVPEHRTAVIIFSALVSLLVIFLHRENIVRLIKGNERKFKIKRGAHIDEK